MRQIHRLALAFGRNRTQQLAGDIEPRPLGIAIRVAAEESRPVGITYAGFGPTSLPHRRPLDDRPWKRSSQRLTLMTEPGRLPHDDRLHGVP